MSITIDYLANHSGLIKPVADWCCREWPWYYDEGNCETAFAYHSRTATLSGIPCALVALDEGRLVGTIALLEEDMDIRSNFSPWLGCLFVDPSSRGSGIASLLMEEGLRLADTRNIPEIFAWTEKLSSPLRAAGWRYLESPIYQGRKVDIFSIEPKRWRVEQSTRAGSDLGEQ